jgi:hypothetical protein
VLQRVPCFIVKESLFIVNKGYSTWNNNGLEYVIRTLNTMPLNSYLTSPEKQTKAAQNISDKKN